MEFPIAAIRVKNDVEDALYIVGRNMMDSLRSEAKPFMLYPFVNRVGVVRLWPIGMPDHNGHQNEWHRSAAIAAAHARKYWVRVSANKANGGYDVRKALDAYPDPEWPPELDLDTMMRVAFIQRGRVIDSKDHPVVKQLQGDIL
jgi:hypothetical protein